MDIENATDQLGLYVYEVTKEVNELVKAGFTTNEAIEIVRIAVEDCKAEIFHHYGSSGITLKLEGSVDTDSRVQVEDLIIKED